MIGWWAKGVVTSDFQQVAAIAHSVRSIGFSWLLRIIRVINVSFVVID